MLPKRLPSNLLSGFSPELTFIGDWGIVETYRNVMELLVKEEVRRQSESLANSLKLTEVVPYALNRLPSLYASSEEGLAFQIRRGRMTFGKQVKQVVEAAIAVVRQNPHRPCTPLQQGKQVRKPATTNEQLHRRKVETFNPSTGQRQPNLQIIQPTRSVAASQHPTTRPGQLSAAPAPKFGRERTQPTTAPTKKRDVSWQEYKRLRKAKQDGNG